ncbi:hypothetical protein CPB83DRAFT_842180 [Crepidotus variabilis]|uniref:Uncharacterized protein n=1 Tax=Crepidotus variabilis TaxID=179855 RepID=A0A9P6JX00_9AGAR|nr:hypothetical protein CPB83DRAFT_842180 [Crepidotus variabilis]
MFTNGSPHSSHKEHRPLAEEIEDDQKSTISQESGVPRTDGALLSLQLVAGNRVRHGRCAPEFLEEMATKGAYDSFRRSLPKKLKVITGQEARQFFKNYISEHSKRQLNDKVTKNLMPSPIAFAVTAWEGSTKYVDYYMTWRGMKNAHKGKELEQRIELLDSEFRRLVKKLDEEYKRITALKSHGNLSPLKRKFQTTPSASSHSSKKAHPPAAIDVSLIDADALQDLTTALPEPPASAADSVMSLPLLSMIRNVPLSHRVPLRVTNPDRLSMLSEDTLPAIMALTSGAPTKPVNHTPLAENSTNTLAVPSLRRHSKHINDNDVRKSVASVKSSDTGSSRSSRLSRSSSLSRSENRSSSLDRHHQLELNEAAEKRHYTDDDLPEFLLVFLGDKLESDTTSWHGLERQISARTLPADRHSPWLGPLARTSSNGLRYSPSQTPSETGSDDSGFADSWNTTPIAPVQSLMEAMGHSHPYYHSPPVVPGAQYISVGQMGSPGPAQSPYLYSSPRMDASHLPYIPWQLQTPTAVSNSRPPSRAYSAASRGSPYLQAHMGF